MVASRTHPAARDQASLCVLLVDDHDLYRQGLRRLLTAYGMENVHEASNGSRALEMAAQVSPDVIVMDLRMPGMSGLEATRSLAARQPTSPVLMLSVSASPGDLEAAVAAGARGYLLKSATAEEIVAGIRSLAAGGGALAPELVALVLERLRTGRSGPVDPGPCNLTERERAVLALLVAGRDNARIAAALNVSPGTVKNHVSSLLRKLGVENRMQAAVYAVRNGLA